jgi:hypothetical protein
MKINFFKYTKKTFFPSIIKNKFFSKKNPFQSNPNFVVGEKKFLIFSSYTTSSESEFDTDKEEEMTRLIQENDTQMENKNEMKEKNYKKNILLFF